MFTSCVVVFCLTRAPHLAVFTSLIFVVFCLTRTWHLTVFTSLIIVVFCLTSTWLCSRHLSMWCFVWPAPGYVNHIKKQNMFFAMFTSLISVEFCLTSTWLCSHHLSMWCFVWPAPGYVHITYLWVFCLTSTWLCSHHLPMWCFVWPAPGYVHITYLCGVLFDQHLAMFTSLTYVVFCLTSTWLCSHHLSMWHFVIIPEPSTWLLPCAPRPRPERSDTRKCCGSRATLSVLHPQWLLSPRDRGVQGEWAAQSFSLFGVGGGGV